MNQPLIEKEYDMKKVLISAVFYTMAIFYFVESSPIYADAVTRAGCEEECKEHWNDRDKSQIPGCVNECLGYSNTL